jgi:hypothetical protein
MHAAWTTYIICGVVVRMKGSGITSSNTVGWRRRDSRHGGAACLALLGLLGTGGDDIFVSSPNSAIENGIRARIIILRARNPNNVDHGC